MSKRYSLELRVIVAIEAISAYEMTQDISADHVIHLSR
jgi:hypothetical protein